MSRSARIGGGGGCGGGGGGRSPVDYEASGDSEDKLSEVIDIHTDHDDDDDDDDDDKDVEDEHDDAESSSGGDWEADEGVMWFERRAAVIRSTGKAENHRRAIAEDAAVATATATAAAAAAAAAVGEKGGKEAAKNEPENELEDNRRFWEACLANEYTQFVDCANS